MGHCRGSGRRRRGGKFAGDLSLTVPGPASSSLPVVSIVASATPVTEGTAAAFTLSRTGATDAALTVAVSVSESGASVSGTPPTSVTFAAASASATLSVATKDDEVAEDASTVTATVSSGSGYTVSGTSGSADVVVADDDATPVVTTASPIVVAENATSVATLSATDADTAAADLSWSIPAGAAGGADAAQFALTADGVLSFRAAKDYEAPDDAEVTVRVTDGANPVDAALVVLSDVDDVAPVLSSASVDGAVLTLTFGEALDADSVAPESSFAVTVGGSTRAVDAVAVSGSAVSGSAVSGSAVSLTLSAAVETGDTVTVDYTVPTGESANKLQDASGNTAESFSGQAVTNNTSSSATPRTVPTPAPGAPNSLKVARHESGKLLASWNAPDSGPAPTGYTVQWKESADDWDDADDVSVANVKGTSHVITGLTDGVEYAVRVVARKGDAAGDPSGEVTATPQETVAPSPSAATVDGATLTITFDEPLDAGETPENSAFAVTVAGSSRGVDTVSVSGSAVTLTLASAVAAGETVTVDYTVPTGQSTNKLQDTSGNAAASFSGQAATNNTQAADPLTASVSAVPGSQSGEFTFELRFSETPRKKFSYKIMRDHAFTVTGGQVTKARRLVPRSNVGWEIHVQPDGDGDGTVTIVLPATTDCTAEGAICTQDGRKLSNRLEITVQGPAG